jgi:plasmid stability protein
MATLTIRNLTDAELSAFRVLAAERGRSMEAEARELIRAVIPQLPKPARVDLETLPEVDAEIRARVERAQAKVRAMFGGTLPKGRVDAFIAERRAAAERGE